MAVLLFYKIVARLYSGIESWVNQSWLNKVKIRTLYRYMKRGRFLFGLKKRISNNEQGISNNEVFAHGYKVSRVDE
jgi:hypothetical protein